MDQIAQWNAMQDAADPRAVFAAQKPTKKKDEKKKRNFWLDQISTGLGIAGGIGGGILGAAAGGVGAVPGAAIGGGAGSALGEAIENLIDPKSGDWGNVAEEGALGAIFSAGPLKLGKAALGTRAALQGGEEAAGMGLKAALRQGSKEAEEFTIRGALGKKAGETARNAATKQFALSKSQLNNFRKAFGEDAGDFLLKRGIGSADDVTNAITKQKGIFDELVQGAGNVKKSTVQKRFASAIDDLMKAAPSDQKLLGQRLSGEADQFLSQFGDEIPATALNQFKNQYDNLVNYTTKMADPNRYGVNKRVADVLRETIQDASGSKQLKETGRELQKLIRLGENIADQAGTAASRSTSPLGLRNLMGASAGGAAGFGLGGPAGAAIGAAGTAAINSPTGRRALARGAESVAGRLTESGAKAAASSLSPLKIGARLGGVQLAKNAIGGAQAAEQPQTPSTLEDALMQDTSGFGGYEQQVQSPYSKANLLYDMQRDPKNADKYIEYYQMLDEIFNPVQEQKALTQGQQERSDLVNALGQVEGLMGQGSINYGPIGSRVEGIKSVFNAADPETLSYKNAVSGLRAAITKARAGASLTPGELKMLAQYTPSDTDSEQVVRSKLAQLRAIYGYGQPVGGGSSLEEALMSMQGGY